VASGNTDPVKSAQFPYVAIAEALRQRLAAGEWAPGAQLPTVGALAAEYRVSRATIAKAVELLADEGLVVRVARWGIFRPEDG